jgi:hypothetical protein
LLKHRSIDALRQICYRHRPIASPSSVCIATFLSQSALERNAPQTRDN